MAARITPHLVQLTYDAALKSFWRKGTLKRFLRQCGVTDSFLATWADDESKRELLDRLFGKLQENETRQTMFLQMAHHLADQTSFPDLQNWEDSKEKIAAANQAVAALRKHLRAEDERARSEREREESRQRAQRERDDLRRAQTDRLSLQKRLEALHVGIGTAKAGYDFQAWFFDLLDFCEITNRRPYTHDGRQIDGALTLEGTTYLIELKFQGAQADAPDIDSLSQKVQKKADNTMGIMVSISGYSSVAIRDASGPRTPLLLVDSSHLYLFLTGTMKFQDVVNRVRRHAAQTGEAYLPVGKFSG